MIWNRAREARMATKRHKAEQIVRKLRETEGRGGELDVENRSISSRAIVSLLRDRRLNR